MHKSPSFLLSAALTLFNSTAFSATNPSIVELQTNLGTITLQLNYAKAPITAKNFISYVNSGFYNSTLFHRVLKDFVIQGGGADKKTGQFKQPQAPIKNEATNGLKNLKGTIAMARGKQLDTATSQFFINLVDNADLNIDATKPDSGYAVFGKVIKGMNVVESIGQLATIKEIPYTELSEVISIDNTYVSNSLNPKISTTRIVLNGQGTVISSPSGINCGIKCSLSQATGTKLTLKAIPATGFQFAGWRGDCQGFTATLAINTKQGNHNCMALFYQTK